MLATEPRPVGGVITAGLRLAIASLAPLWPLFAIAALPQTLVASYLVTAGPRLDPGADAAALDAYAQEMLRYLPALYLSLVFNITAVAAGQSVWARSGRPGPVSALARGLKLTPALLVLLCAYVAIGSLGLIAFVLPGLILLVNLCLFPYVPIMEARSPWSGLARSQQLIWSAHWWRAAAVTGTIVLLGLVIGEVIGTLVAVIDQGGADSTGGFSVPRLLASWATLTLFTPISTALMLALYQDLLLRDRTARNPPQAPPSPPPPPPPPGRMDA
ncbi:MAG: hypothetical protein AAGI15_13885 [Pseudomonadota bacterium]